MNTFYPSLINHPFLDDLINSSAAGIACFDENFKLSTHNELICSMLGVEALPEKLTDLDLFTSQEISFIKDELQKPLSKDFTVALKFISEKGSTSILNVTLAVKFAGDQLVGSILKVIDVTADLKDTSMAARMQNKIQENEELFKSLYQKSPLGILMINSKNGNILRANPRICKMLGYTEVEMLQLSAYDITHPDDRLIHKKKYQTSLREEDKAFDFNKRYIKKDGSEIWVNIAASIIKDASGNPLYDLATVQDISEKVKTQSIVKKQVEELNTQNLKLEQYIDSNLQLENFAYIASHDLKAPLRTIGNFAQLLNRRLASQFGNDEKDYMEYILEGVKDMNQLIENLLIYSKINSTENTVRKLDTMHILNNVLRNLHANISEKKAHIIIEDIPEKIIANKTKLTQLFQNLITNGIKFHRPGIQPQIVISGKELTDFWQFQVADNGIGIDKEYFDRVFTLFKRLHGKEEYEGSGIGLAYCKRVIEKHKGDIWLDSKPGKGTTFFFTIKKLVNE